MNITRRTALKNTAGALALSAVAGCLDDAPGQSTDGEAGEGYAAFLAVHDWAEQVAGDRMSFENPVEVGQMGHGWEPSGDLTIDVAESDSFVYLDTPEFGWAQDLAHTLEQDYDDVAVIDGMADLDESDLLGVESPVDRTPDTDAEYDPDELRIAEFQFVDMRTGDVSAWWHDDHWDGGLPDVEIDGERTMQVVVEDSEGRLLPLGEQFEIEPLTSDDASAELVDLVQTDEEFTVTGLAEGRAFLEFELLYDGTPVFDTGEDFLPISVVEEADENEGDEFHDPHVWVDPILAMEIVETIADGLSELDPDGEERYRENAREYIEERLEPVHEAFEELAAEATVDTAVFAGHDSFRYVQERYGLQLESPVGIAPDEEISESDVAALIELIDDNGIDVVLYDPFEAQDPDEDVPRAAAQLVEFSDATEAMPLTPAEGTTPNWAEEGYGWYEQMMEITIPSLRAAFGAD